ncbi:hypothetical protein PUY42_002567 [Salmonella enterica]|uniref:hypothetical protein n=1 Tax=Citrobacter braakii TaxID=57706 RepID=UPI001FFE5F54|nr:hypothetical protein [Citrobacter braakii]EKM4781664.1 hypothetical protein [Salmonella enterica]MCK2155762.1 hypothetical protein [Citrobacter braakii]MEB0965214.1 hypothetical protein [Citrobacter braakii]WFV20305.1 hypothetical protein NFJ22_11405 [Citrobacter braakii]
MNKVSNNKQARIAFVYSGSADLVLAGDSTPTLGISCNKFPSEKSIVVHFGVIGFNGKDNYSLEIKIFHDEEDVTLSNLKHNNLLNYKPKWSNDGEFVALMAAAESFTAIAPGIYRIEANLLFREAKPDTIWESIDLKTSYFAVDKNWSSKIDNS